MIVPELRKLHFDTLDAATAEVQSLLESGYERRGNWSLGQICHHICLVQDPSIDGYPQWFSLFAFLRPLMRLILLPRLMSGNSPQGIPTAPIFVPSNDVDDADEVSKFIASIARFKAHEGQFAPHPGFGRMDREALEGIHAAHAAHHLRFLEPRSCGQKVGGSSPTRNQR